MAKIMEALQRMMTRIQVGVVDPSEPSVSWEMLSKDILSTKLLWRSIGPVAPGGMGVSPDSSCAARGAEMAKMAMTTTVAAMQQQQGVRLHVDESGMLGFGLPWELELTFHHQIVYSGSR